MSIQLYSWIPKSKLQDILQTLHSFTELPLHLADTDGNDLLSFGNEYIFCTLMKKHVFSESKCHSIIINAAQNAQRIGEAYIFSCPGNLNHISFSLTIHGIVLGCVVIGPFLMDTPDSTLVSTLAEERRLTPSLSLELYDGLVCLPVLHPSRVQILKKMTEYLFSPLISEEQTLRQQSRVELLQQSQINEAIQVYKGKEKKPSSLFFYEKEQDLLAKVRTGNLLGVKALLNDLLGYVLFHQGGRLESVRIRSIELTTLLSRVAIEGGADVESIYAFNNKLLPKLYQEPELEKLCLTLQDIVENFMQAMFSEQDKGNLYIRKALRYMNSHYFEHLSMTSVAEYVQLSPSYFSSLFRKIVGTTFRKKLTMIRIEESKRLLLSTDHTLTDIAVAVGFPDQSYYCKTFKRIVGIPPGKYRG